MKEKDESSQFIDILLSDQLAYYRKYIDLINSIADNSEFVRIIPILNRNLLENLLRDIFSSSLKGEFNYLYFNQNAGQIRNLSTLLDLFNNLRKEFRESYALDIPDKIIGYLDRFRKDGNYGSHEIETLIKSTYTDEIKEDLNTTIRVLVQLFQKIINSDKKINKINEKILKTHSENIKSDETSKIIKLISSIRNDITSINSQMINDPITISLNEKERLQQKIDKLHIRITKVNLSTDSLIGIINNLSKLEFSLHSKAPNKNTLLNYLEYISVYFKANLINLSEDDITIARQQSKIKDQKILITFLSIISVIFMILSLIAITVYKINI
ncbi:MAG: hypothetical protein ACFFDF_05770 [Candidatus Odinarchaeota archaeon]